MRHLLQKSLPSRPRRLALALSRLLAGSLLLGAGHPAQAELPVPADVLVAPGAGSVLAPQISGNTMTIRQLSDKATLDWKSFNIDAGSAVHFEQPRATSVALNNIHQSDPSRIFGALTANGQVFLINQNGFVFGKDAQVNVNALVASSLNIAQDTFQRGIARAFEQGLPALAAVDANGQPTRQLYLQGADGQPVLDGNGQKVKIQILVEAGARLKTNAADGRIILAAPSVTNQGHIEAPGGQVILAAAQDKVYLQLADSSAGINGFLVEVGTGGEINNVGKVLAERGNASLIGFAVNQQGIVSATTSVRINGSVRLLAREGIQDPSLSNGLLKPLATKRAQDQNDGLGRRATVNLAPGSRTGVDLDADKSQTAIDGQPQQASIVDISGHQVILQNQATVQAKAGRVTLAAVDDPALPLVKGDARIYLDAGSRIDVSGVKDVSLPMERNVLKVELRKNEMRDAPLQKNGILYGKTVSVDLRDAIGADGAKHIPIADLQGALDRIARNIDERSTAGGVIALRSSGDVIARPGSVLDFSGGSVAYQAGNISTTKLVDEQGRIYDIGKADPNRRYVSIFGEWVKEWTKWGVTERWTIPGPLANGVYEPGYTQGAAAGKLDIAAFEAMLDGILKGGAVDGIRQRHAAERADGGSLSIDLRNGSLVSRQDVVFAAQHAVDKLGPGDALPRQADATPNADASAGSEAPPLALTLDTAALQSSGVRHVSVNTNGKISIGAGQTLALPAASSLTLSGLGFDVQGAIIAPAGDVTLQASTDTLANPITLGASARIDVRGQWVNDRLDLQQGRPLSPIAIDGGTVSLNARQANLRLEAGSRIDASGGAWLPGGLNLDDSTEVLPTELTDVKAGQGGAISLSAATTFPGKPSSSLLLGGQLAAWGLQSGGALKLESNEVAVGAAPARPGSKMTPLLLQPEFFRQGGFADYQLSANVYGINIADGVTLAP
ncbi:MAG: filamentous hemagglutinin N-terminal domain-containing protein, partial [Candidatus Methylumidiphilus sp.]